MSSTTAPAEIHVPRELLCGMLHAQSHEIYECAKRIDDNFGGALEEPWRSRDTETVSTMAAALNVRLALDRAVDRDEAIAVEIVRALVHEGIAYYEPYEDGSSDDGHPEIRRDLTAWAHEHGFIEREAVTA